MTKWKTEHTFHHSWETLAQAVWKKYPNPFNTKVIGIDIVDRKVENGILHSSRLFINNWGLQYWVQKLIGNDYLSHGYEVSEVDPSGRIMTVKTKNITFSNTVQIYERLIYQQHPENKDHTLLIQETDVAVIGLPFKSNLEDYLQNSMISNSLKGRKALEWIISGFK